MVNSPSSEPRREPFVLVVEDDQHALSGYVEFLDGASYDVVGVHDGAEALKLAQNYPPDLVVTDIQLPGLTGFELSAALHADPQLKDIPVIGLTAHWTSEVRAKATSVGMITLLLKPCVPSHLLAEIERMLRHARLLESAPPPRPLRMVLP